ncbi:MAG: PKD-like domain-containing protein, partial [Bacteroidales bacterium]
LPGTTYSWTRDNTTNVTGIVSNGTGDISGTLRNVTGTDQTVIFTIIPTGGNGCVGDAITATVLVHPEPVALATPASQVVCSNIAITTIILSTSNSLPGTTYSWTRDNTTNVTGIGGSGNGDISGTLRNVTGTDQTVTFTIIPTGGNGCVGDAITATVLVHPEPIGEATPASQTICSKAAITTIVLTTGNGMDGVTIYGWTRDNTTNVTGIGASGTGNISGTLRNVTGTDQTVTFTIIPTSGNSCAGDAITSTVLVHPEPVAVATPSSLVVCSNIAITTIILSTSNSLPGTTYSWIRDNTTNVTGIVSNGTGDISGTLRNVTGTDQTVIFTIIPTGGNGCVGDAITATVLVHPEPLAVATPASQVVCSNIAITTIVLTTSNSLPGTTYSWTRDNTTNVTGIGGSGSGDISGTLRNVTGTDQTVTFTIIPTSGNSCSGDAITATVLLHPEPVGVATPTSQTICSKAAITTIVLTTGNGMDGVTTYGWTRDNTTNVTGIGASGNGDISGTLRNVTGTDQTVTFTIIPTGGNGCEGDAITATVLVHPEPVAVATPASQVVCSNIAITTIILSTSNSLPGTTYSWIRDNTTNVTGIVSNGTGDISGTLRNVTGTDQTVIFTIIPTGGNGCVGDAITATILVHPEPVAVATPSSQVVCSNIAIATIVLSTSNSLPGTTYSWIRDNTTNVTGIVSNGTGDITGTLRNVTGTDQAVIFTIIPTGGNGCVGDAITATVLVHPEPVVVATPASQVVCSNIAITTIVLSTSNSLPGTTYSWTRDNTTNVTGIGGSGNGDISGTLRNVTETDQTVTFTILPTGGNGCVGDAITATVLVHPEPVAVATPASQVVCSNIAITTIVLTTSNSLPGTTYSWIRDNTTNVTGIGGSGSGDISGTLRNVTGTDQTVIFTIIPTGGNGCEGDAITATVLVHPEPVAVATPSSQAVCSNIAIATIVLSTSNSLPGTTYSWTRDNTTNVTGIVSNGTGDISGTLRNVTGTDQTVTFTIIPTGGNGCVGDAITATVLVHPEPVAVATPSSQVVCSNIAITTIILSTSNSLPGTTYSWTRDNTTNVTGIGGSGSGDISGTLRNVTGTDQTVTFTILPTGGNGCSGDVITATVILHPEPVGVATPASQTICSNTAITTIVLTTGNGMDGVTTYGWTRDNTTNVTGIGATGTGDISGTLRNVTGTDQTVIFTIIPTGGNSCAGDAITATVLVHPEPVGVATPPAQTVCSDAAITPIILSTSNNLTGTIFEWTRDNTINVTGLAAAGSGDISGTPSNSTDIFQTLTYTIIPTSAIGCIGNTFTTTVTVNPTPQVIPSALTQTICNNAVTSVVLRSPSIFTSGVITFNYNAVGTGGVTGFASSVTGLPNNYVISDVLHNPTDTSQTVTYTITPISPTGCLAGPGKIVVITVDPTPQVIPNTLAQTICNDGTTNIILTSPTIFLNGVITFNYTVVATGNVTGFNTPVTGLLNNSVIADELHNPTDEVQTVTYTIVPISPICSTDNPIKIVTVTVEPTPRATIVTTTPIVCNGSNINVTINSPTVTTIPANLSYVVSVTSTDDAHLGGSASTGFTKLKADLPFSITGTLTNSSDVPIVVTYTITPKLNGCNDGPVQSVTVTVEPTPQATIVTTTPIVCNGGNIDVTINSPTVTTTSANLSYVVSVTSTDDAHLGGSASTGFTKLKADLPFSITGTLTNSSDVPIVVTYTITPKLNGCSDGPVQSVTVTVEPIPQATIVTTTPIVCNGSNIDVTINSPTVTTTSANLSYVVLVTSTDDAHLGGTASTGFTKLKSDLPFSITGTLTNSSDVPIVVTYTITPKLNGCSDGPKQYVTISVNPTPRVIPVNSQICYGGTTSITLTSPSVMTQQDVIKFDYYITATASPAVVSGNRTSATNIAFGTILAFPYTNESDTIQSVFYHITPTAHSLGCPSGTEVPFEIKVHAQPLQSLDITKQLTCSSGSGNAALRATISKGAGPYQVVWDGPVHYHKADSLAIANLSNGTYVVKITDNLGCNRKDSISIVAVTARPNLEPVVIQPGNYNISCIGSTDGSIRVSVTGGITPPYNYWFVKNGNDILYSGILSNNRDLSDPSTYMNYNNLGAGSYKLIIRDINGCMDSTSLVFRVPPPIVVTFGKSLYTGGFNISCKGYNNGAAWIQTISGGRPGGYTYRWYTFTGNIPGPVNTTRIDNLTAGTYFLETKDPLGCVKIDSTLITEPDGLQLSGYQLSKSTDGNFNISCFGGNDGSIALTLTGGSGNNLYSWTGPAGFTASTKDLTGLKAGIYTCLVTDQNGCVLTPSPSITLTEPFALVLNPPVTSISTDGAYNISCSGSNSGWISISVSGGSIGTYKYNWSTSDGSGIINGQKDQTSLTAGTYHLIVTDSNSCVITKDITLTQPPVLVTQLSTTNITCKSPGFNNGSINLKVTGGIAPYNFLWSNGEITQDLAGLTPGNYLVTVTDFNGCIKKDSARVYLPPSLNYTKVLSDYNGYNISCNGMANGFINIEPTTGSPPFVYTWTGPNGFIAATRNISNLLAGQYQLSIVDSNECKASDIFDLTEPGKLGFSYTLSSSIAGGYNINCAGDRTGFIDIEPVNQVKTVDYLWADGIFGKTRTNLPAGNYNIIITDANNCHASSEITLTEPDSMKLILNILPPFCPDKPDGTIGTDITGGVKGTGYLYRWSDNSSSSNIINIKEGFYKVIVTDMNGCSVTDSSDVKAINKTCLIIPNIISPNGDLINDVWNIGMKELYPSMEVIIFNRWGETVWRSEKGYPRPWDGTSNGSSLPIDSYHYIIDLHNGSRPLVGNITIVR